MTCSHDTSLFPLWWFQMSGAKVDLLDVVSGTSEGIVKISGTPEQTQSAQRLLQELILNAQTSSLGYT